MGSELIKVTGVDCLADELHSTITHHDVTTTLVPASSRAQLVLTVVVIVVGTVWTVRRQNRLEPGVNQASIVSTCSTRAVTCRNWESLLDSEGQRPHGIVLASWLAHCFR